MQILQWLFRTPHDACEKDGVAVITRCRSERRNDERLAKPRDLVVYSAGAAAPTGGSSEELEGDDEDGRLTVVLNGEYLGTCFYGALQLKQLRSVLCRSNSSPWRREGGVENFVGRMGHKAPESSGCSGTAANVGCKVLPICDGAAPSTSSNAGCSSGSLSDGSSDKDSAQRGERRKAVSRVKELLRWAATAKSPGRAASKGWKVMYFRSKVGLKGGGGDDQLDDAIGSSAASSKISFKWDAGGRCSTMSSSACSPLATSSGKAKNNLSRLSSTSQCAAELEQNALGSPKSEDYVRNGQWITTDADFVVLEL